MKDAWANAAQTWRLPFWDWDAHPDMPLIATSPTAEIDTPDGGKFQDNNPMYKFIIPNKEPIIKHRLPDSPLFDTNGMLYSLIKVRLH